MKWKSLSPLCNLMDYSPTVGPHGPRVHGILQEWVAFPFSKKSSQPRDQIQVSHIEGGFFTSWATGKPKNTVVDSLSLLQLIFPKPGIKPRSPALKADSLPTELSGKPYRTFFLSLVNIWEYVPINYSLSLHHVFPKPNVGVLSGSSKPSWEEK